MSKKGSRLRRMTLGFLGKNKEKKATLLDESPPSTPKAQIQGLKDAASPAPSGKKKDKTKKRFRKKVSKAEEIKNLQREKELLKKQLEYVMLMQNGVQVADPSVAAPAPPAPPAPPVMPPPPPPAPPAAPAAPAGGMGGLRGGASFANALAQAAAARSDSSGNSTPRRRMSAMNAMASASATPLSLMIKNSRSGLKAPSSPFIGRTPGRPMSMMDDLKKSVNRGGLRSTGIARSPGGTPVRGMVQQTSTEGTTAALTAALIRRNAQLHGLQNSKTTDHSLLGNAGFDDDDSWDEEEF